MNYDPFDEAQFLSGFPPSFQPPQSSHERVHTIEEIRAIAQLLRDKSRREDPELYAMVERAVEEFVRRIGPSDAWRGVVEVAQLWQSGIQAMLVGGVNAMALVDRFTQVLALLLATDEALEYLERRRDEGGVA